MAADKVLIIAKSIHTSVELVSSRLCNSIDCTTCKTTLTNVEWCYIDLNLLNGFHRNWLRTCLSAIRTIGSKTKYVVIHCTVNHKRIVTVVCSCKRHCAIT